MASEKTHTFRVHFADSTHFDVDATSPAEAGKKAKAEHDQIITKVKILKESRS